MKEQQSTILELSKRLVKAQEPIRILDAIKWSDEIKHDFFRHKGEKLPSVGTSYYEKNPLNFDIQDKRDEFNGIIRDTQNQLGQYSVITQLIDNRCHEYIKAIDMLACRGRKEFSDYSKELYGSPDDAFYYGGPKLSELGLSLGNILHNLHTDLVSEKDEKNYSAKQAIDILQPKLMSYFGDNNKVVVKLSDNIVADAAAGADTIKLNSQKTFSDRDLRYLEVHEGWVHVGTTINGQHQPYCTFLAKGSPSSTVTQEGLAVITELFTMSSSPNRMLKISNRVKGIELSNQGANFIDVYRFFLDQNYQPNDAYHSCVRIFRGSTSEYGPFTKDLSYTKGLVLIYNFMRLAVQKNQVHLIPLMFCGKVLLPEVKLLAKLVEQGLVIPPTYLPPQFADLSAICSWMAFSLYLNRFDLAVLGDQYDLF